jgi:hypothetical protein
VVTREIAALEFLLGIPLQAERTIVHQGWMHQQDQDPNNNHHNHNHYPNNNRSSGRDGDDDDEEGKVEVLELPTEQSHPSTTTSTTTTVPSSSHPGRWWEKWITTPNPNTNSNTNTNKDAVSRHSRIEEQELEQPLDNIIGGAASASAESSTHPKEQLRPQQGPHQRVVPVVHAPGRRLEGDEATRVQIPLTVDTSVITRQKNIALMAVTREWELQLAHGIGGSTTSTSNTTTTTIPNHTTTNTNTNTTTLTRASGTGSNTNTHTHKKTVHPPMLDGRLFFSAGESYPLQVYSLLRYEPKKEEAARRRQKLEARGGGGTQFFIMPVRDWRGISYRALLPPNHHPHHHHSTRGGGRPKKKKKKDVLNLFDRFASSSRETTTTTTTTPTSTNGPKTAIHGKELASTSGNKKSQSEREGKDRSDDDESESDDSDDDEEDTYVTGLIDDPEMVQGRHRNVMIGDRVAGPIVSSTIQFVKPQLLKADLNKQFRERFDGWEPPKSQRQYIGARVIDGIYTLLDPSATGEEGTGNGNGNGNVGTSTTTTGTQEGSHQTTTTAATIGTGTGTITPPPRNHHRQGSLSSLSTGADAKETIRMPPSLTLSKIRSVKQQALVAAVKAKIEISTVALAIVYFERLCLDCRVDKQNRRLSFAACLLLAIKINEAHVELVMTEEKGVSSKNTTTNRIQSLIRPTKKSGSIFASLLEFFTQDWNISLQHLFAAEWGVFAALQFRLHAKPSQVAFHYKQLLKSLGWNPRTYLGAEMHGYYQEELAREEYLRVEREARREARQQKKERTKILQLQREIESANRREIMMSATTIRAETNTVGNDDTKDLSRTHKSSRRTARSSLPAALTTTGSSPKKAAVRQVSRIGGILNRFSGAKRAMSSDKLASQAQHQQQTEESLPQIPMSPSMPVIAGAFSNINIELGDDFAVDIHAGANEGAKVDDCGSDQSVRDSEEGGIMI